MRTFNNQHSLKMYISRSYVNYNPLMPEIQVKNFESDKENTFLMSFRKKAQAHTQSVRLNLFSARRLKQRKNDGKVKVSTNF